MSDHEEQPEEKPKPWRRCLFGHKWNQYTMDALAPNEDGSYRPAEVTITACDRCGRVR